MRITLKPSVTTSTFKMKTMSMQLLLKSRNQAKGLGLEAHYRKGNGASLPKKLEGVKLMPNKHSWVETMEMPPGSQRAPN